MAAVRRRLSPAAPVPTCSTCRPSPAPPLFVLAPGATSCGSAAPPARSTRWSPRSMRSTATSIRSARA